jgi:thymidylate synthase (FAD)
MSNNSEFAHGFVFLDSSMADDLSVVNSARVSFAKKSDRISEAEIGLINFLMRERHGTPFEHNSFRFHIKCPIFVAREWFRHRIGSFNEFSARYSEVGDEFFSPNVSDVRSQVGKPGSYSFERMNIDDSEAAIAIINKANDAAYRAYKDLIYMGVAKELARVVLPVSMYTQFFWTVNARALMNFLSLRNAPNAQIDIQRYAQDVERIFKGQMPITYEAWVKNGRVAP